MNIRRSRSLSLLACAVLLIGPFLDHAAGQEQKFTDANCALTLPPGWEDLTPAKDKPEPVCAAFGTPDHRHRLTIMIYGRGKSSEPMDRWFVREVDGERAPQSDAGRKVAGRIIEVAGLKCYERRGVLNDHGARVYTLVRAVPTGEGMYFLQAAVTGDEIEDAPDVQQALASFRFLRPPPRAVKTYSARELLISVLMIGLLIAVLLFIIGLCLRLKRHTRAAVYAPHLSAEGEPPPLPPAPPDPSPGPYDY